MSSEISIQAKDVSKAYNIYRRPEDRLKQMFSFRGKKHYDEYWALKGADLTVHRGETIGLIGRNGSGKSTFLQLICGTLTPTSGNIRINGRVAALLELGAGFNPEFTGRENVYISAAILGLTKTEIEERFDAIAEFAGIGDFIDQPVKVYSSGMYARLAFAVAAHVDADIMIVDEILAVGDAPFTQRCMRFFHRFKQTGTLLFVSHDITAVTTLCDRVVWLDRGEIRSIGEPKEICHEYLAALNEEMDETGAFRIGGQRKRQNAVKIAPKPDVRAEILSQSQFSNTLEIFRFDPNAPWFGQRGATIEDVRLLGLDGEPLSAVQGGEEVILRVDVLACQRLKSPIIGWLLKNRLGQPLFGDNTYITYQFAPLTIEAGQRFHGTFRFQLPYLSSGDYAVTAAIAEGSAQNHIQHHWVDEAMFVRVVASHVCYSLVGIPMHDIKLQPD